MTSTDTKSEQVIKKINLRALEYSPNRNPLAEFSIDVKKRRVKTSSAKNFVDPDTGELASVAAVYTFEERDDKEFVKVFAEGVKLAFSLSGTAHKVFQVVLQVYQETPMKDGYVDAIYLAWFDGGLSGRNVGMSDRTFHNGLKELLQKGFLHPKSPNLYWVNPALFFKGDRVRFIKEYRRRPQEEHQSIVQPEQATLDIHELTRKGSSE